VSDRITDIKSFIAEFEACRLPKVRWTHQAHLTVGLWYVSRLEFDDALNEVRIRIRSHNESVGTPNTESNGYHETLTRLYLTAIANHRQKYRELPFENSLKLLLASPLADSKWPLLYYTPGRLFSARARHVWIEPDRKPLEPPGT
jgi:hypothetical protein